MRLVATAISHLLYFSYFTLFVYRYYSDHDEDAEASGDVISIHDDDSEPESSSEPAAKLTRLSDDISMTTAAEADTGLPDQEVTMLEYWQANSYNVHLAAEDTDDADVLFAKCPRLRNVACLCVDLKPGEMLYLPASWLYEVLHTYTCTLSFFSSQLLTM